MKQRYSRLQWNLGLTNARGLGKLAHYVESLLYQGSFTYIALLTGLKNIICYIKKRKHELCFNTNFKVARKAN